MSSKNIECYRIVKDYLATLTRSKHMNIHINKDQKKVVDKIHPPEQSCEKAF